MNELVRRQIKRARRGPGRRRVSGGVRGGVAVVQLGEAAAGNALATANKGAEGDVLLVGAARVSASELFVGEVDEPVEIAFPQGLGSGRLAGPEQVQPVGDGMRCVHCS